MWNPGKLTVVKLVLVAVLFCCASAVSSAEKVPITSEEEQAYKALAGEVSRERLSQTINTLASFGSRVVGYPGCEKAGQWVERQFREIGLQDVKAEPFHATVPIDEGASIRVGGRTFTLHCLWPNLVRTSQLPKTGITGGLIYGENGKLASFNGYNVKGSVVLMEFNSGAEWLNAPRLGAKAVIFIEPKETIRGEAESKFISIPISIPRFWVSRKDAKQLLRLCTNRQSPQALVKARMTWQRKAANNITGIIPGTDPELRDQIVIIEAFYDSTSVVPNLAPGAENACSLASMLELARAFKKHPPGRTVWFVATSGHFESLLGVRAYIERHVEEWGRPNVFARAWSQASHVLPLVPQYEVNHPPDIYFFGGLDMTSHSNTLGVFYKGYFYDQREDIQGRFSDSARACRENADKIGKVLGFEPKKRFADGVNPVQGKNWRNFIPGKIALDVEAMSLAGATGLAFVTTEDARSLIDTPFDTPDKVNIGNLAEQTELLVCLYHNILHDTNDLNRKGVSNWPVEKPSMFSRMYIQGGFARLEGQVLILNLKKGYIPNDPVPGSLMIVRHPRLLKTLMGVRGNIIDAVDSEARFRIPGVAPATAYFGEVQPTQVAAYRLDPDSGEIAYSPDMGTFGADYYPTNILMKSGIKDIPVVVFKCRATSIFDLIDPQLLKTMPTLDIFDAATNGRPRMFGWSLAVPEPGSVASGAQGASQSSYVEDVAVVFTVPDSRIKITMAAGPAATRLLLLDCTPKNPEGEGYLVGNGTSITNTSLRVARDMWALNNFRIKRLAKYRIINEGINALQKAARVEIDAAEKSLAALNYSTLDAHARAAWGYASRAYPDVQKTASDVLNGVLFYLALMIPFAYFMERLLLGSADLKRQLAGTFVIFLLIFLAFRFTHPAFDIAINPMVIFIAFVMLSLSLLVIVIVVNKFEEMIKTLNRQVGGVHRVDIGRMSIASAAFSLGISNMRRRKARTVLTCITLILLTFVVLSFTSIVQVMRFNKIPAPGVPSYNGLMLRTANWEVLQEPAYRVLRDEFSQSRAVAPRAWFFGAVMGEQSFLPIKRENASFDARALVGLTPQEKDVTHVNESLIAGRWFKPEDNYTVIIPKPIAEALKIDLNDVGRAAVEFSGEKYTVIGITDPDKLKKITDLDGEPVTPVDFILMENKSQQSRAISENAFREYVHLDPNAIVFIPFKTAMNLGADLRSVAISFVSEKEVKKVLDRLMPRLTMNLYAGLGDHVFRYSAIAAAASKGIATVIVPVLIAALIVLNTMLGSVYERVKEIGIFSSLGLAPHHISMLFIAESMVYAIVGAVAGYLIGQGVSKLIYTFDLLPGLYLNFSSISAVLSTLVVVAVVLLSTLYPARKASEVASPARDRNWKVNDPNGDDWDIELPFAVTGDQARGVNSFIAEWLRAYEEQSIGDLVAQDVERIDVPHEAGVCHGVKCRVWLAPFDLGVSQDVLIRAVPTAMEDVYIVQLTIHRESGDVGNWKRANRRFLNTVRRQFLIWRTLRAEDRAKYTAENEVSDVETADETPRLEGAT